MEYSEDFVSFEYRGSHPSKLVSGASHVEVCLPARDDDEKISSYR